MQPQEITIIIHSDIDPSQLLDIATEYGEQIAEEVKTYGENAVSVSYTHLTLPTTPYV